MANVVHQQLATHINESKASEFTAALAAHPGDLLDCNAVFEHSDGKKYTLLTLAVARRSHACVTELLDDARVDVNASGGDGAPTALEVAATNADKTSLRLLMYAKDIKIGAALLMAATADHVGIMTFLLVHFKEDNKMMRTAIEQTYTDQADKNKVDTCAVLIDDKRFDARIRAVDMVNCLYSEALLLRLLGNDEKKLYSVGVDVNRKHVDSSSPNHAHNGCTALMVAAHRGFLEGVNALLKHPMIDVTVEVNGKTAADMAFAKKHHDCAQAISQVCHRQFAADGGPASKRARLVDNCAICRDRPSRQVLIPCGHLCLCDKCALQANNKCPMCRTVARKIVKTFGWTY